MHPQSNPSQGRNSILKSTLLTNYMLVKYQERVKKYNKVKVCMSRKGVLKNSENINTKSNTRIT